MFNVNSSTRTGSHTKSYRACNVHDVHKLYRHYTNHHCGITRLTVLRRRNYTEVT